MKKIGIVLLVMICLTLVQFAYAEEFITGYSKGSIETTATSDGSHNNTVCGCDQPLSEWHCGICHVQHNTNGDYDVVPVCDCNFKIETIPSGYVIKSTRTVPIVHSCGNLPGMQQQQITCTVTYTTAEKKVENNTPACNHTMKCSYGYTSDQHPHGNYKVTGSNLVEKCSVCNKHVYEIACSEESSSTTDSSSDTNTPTPTPSSSSSSSLSSDTDTSTPTPDPPCEHTSTYGDSRHDHGGTIGSQATTDSVSFYSRINTSEEYRRTNPFYLGDGFVLSGRGHIDGSVKHDPKYYNWVCGGYDATYCSSCGEQLSYTPCLASGTSIDWTANTPTFTDTYHTVNMSFTGFEVNGDKKVTYSPSSLSVTSWSKPSRNDTSFSKSYVITKLIPSQLKEDDGKYGDRSSGGNSSLNSGASLVKSGLVYGLVNVSCNCGCVRDYYRIYFDLTPPNPESEVYTLTLEANPTKGGGVSVNADSYSFRDTKTSTVGTSFSIFSKFYEGYKFDAWYKTDGNKYSKLPSLPITMPGYSFKLIAKFLPEERYNVTVYSDGNGTVSFGDGQEAWEISANVLKGSDLSIYANPDENFVVDYWEWVNKVDGTSLGNDSTISIENIQENYVIFVHFKPIASIPEYRKLSTSPYGPGYVLGGTNYAIIGKYYPIWAFPYEGARFIYWKEEPRTITDFGRCDQLKMPNRDYHLTAYFVEDDMGYYQLEVESDGNGLISINAEEDVDKKLRDSLTSVSGDEHIIRAYPDAGFEFLYWTDKYGDIVSNKEEWTVKIIEDEIYIAHFIGIGEYSIIVESAGGGDVTGNVDNAIPGKEYPIKAYPDEGNEFLYWEERLPDEDTGDITDYSDKDWIVMPERDLVLVAHFREVEEEEEDKYYLTLKTSGGGDAFGEGYYEPDKLLVDIRAEADAGYKFVGWYENNQLISKVASSPPIRMPYYNMTLTAVFIKADEYTNSPFKILSVRDIRWQDYFAGGGNVGSNYIYIPTTADNEYILVNDAKLIDDYIDVKDWRDVGFGYAVECELVTAGIKQSESTLVITPTIYKKDRLGNLTKVNINLGEYAEINSSNSEDKSKFMITSEEEIDIISTTPRIENPIVTWNWVYYLPVADDELPSGYKELYDYLYDELDGYDIVIKFDIQVQVANGQRFDYIKVINYMNNVNSGYKNKSDWDGLIFTYDMDRTVFDDIYDDAIN